MHTDLRLGSCVLKGPQGTHKPQSQGPQPQREGRKQLLCCSFLDSCVMTSFSGKTDIPLQNTYKWSKQMEETRKITLTVCSRKPSTDWQVACDWPLRSQPRNPQSLSQQSNTMHTGAHTLPHCSVPGAHVVLLVLLFISLVYELQKYLIFSNTALSTHSLLRFFALLDRKQPPGVSVHNSFT